MKKDQLKKILQPLIKEEVVKVIGDILPGMLAEAILIHEETKKPSKPIVQKSKGESLVEMMGLAPEKRVEDNGQIKYTDNPMLNEILNQTQGGVPQEGTMGAHMTPAMMMAEQMEQQKMDAMYAETEYTPSIAKPGAFDGFDQRAQAMLPTQTAEGAPQQISAEQLAETAPEVLGALTKNYSGFMDKVNKASVKKGPSNIDFSKGV